MIRLFNKTIINQYRYSVLSSIKFNNVFQQQFQQFSEGGFFSSFKKAIKDELEKNKDLKNEIDNIKKVRIDIRIIVFVKYMVK